MSNFDLEDAKSKRKTRSMSTQFIDIDELIDSIDQDETNSCLRKASSCDPGFFGSLHSETTSINSHTNFPSDASTWSLTSPTSPETIQVERTLPIYLKFQDVKYKIAVKTENFSTTEEKCILHGITGSVFPGEVLALMGPSGGGKSTLLSILSGRIKSNYGAITYNDRPYTKLLKQRIGFVLQDDVVYPHLTVKETLTYAALLRLPNTLTRQQKKERAMNVIMELGLDRCQDTIIGGASVRGISGGERKRVCIGNEILLNPSILFLDEPTSGLDSTTALQIVQLLCKISQAGKTVITTIHQPSSRLFSRFDKLILLGKGSSLYYGKASEAMLYFSSIGCSPRIAMNPAEFLIDLANGNVKDKSIPSELGNKFFVRNKIYAPSPGEVHEYLVEAYESRVANMERDHLLKPIASEGNFEMHTFSHSEDTGATWFEQFVILFRRGFKARRHEYLNTLRVTQVISTAFIMGMLWWHSNANSPKGINDQAGLLFFISVFWAFFPIFTAIFTFPQERAMLIKERSVKMYKLSAYVIARNSSDLPLELVLPIIFLVIVYLMVGLKMTFSAFSLTLLTVFLTVIAAQGLGMMIGAAFMDVKKATTLASITVMTFMLSGGFFIARVPLFMSWMRYISFNYHTYRLLLKIQYGYNSPLVEGQRVDSVVSDVGAMLLMIITYQTLAYFFLRKMKLRTLM